MIVEKLKKKNIPEENGGKVYATVHLWKCEKNGHERWSVQMI